VTTWLGQVRTGNEMAAQQLWDRYFPRLVALARKKLLGMPRRAADEEDAALSALASFCRAAKEGRFPQLSDRDNLWTLLVVITAGKAIDLRLRETRKKRGGRQVRGESALDALLGSADGGAGIEQVVGADPTPELVAQLAEEIRRLMAVLTDPRVRATAVMKLEGYTNAEIAAAVGCAEPPVERRLRLIRSRWKALMSN
jgi:DNA-directed RNA polymerase specialized sigma24 family protein